MKPIRLPFLLRLLPAALAGSVASQETLHETLGTQPYLGHGFAVAVVGDVDGDGVDDYWASAPDPWDRGLGTANVRLLSGANGTVLATIDGSETGARFGHALAAGPDLDGDRVPDLAIGASRGTGAGAQSGVVSLRSGATSLELHPVPGLAAGDRFGEALAFVDDRDDDGVADLLVGAPGDDTGGLDAGSVRLVSGASGATLDTFHGAAGSELGTSVADAGDLDGDGSHELLLGAPRGGPAGEGIVFLLDGATSATLACFEGDVAGDLFGYAVAPVGDGDADGTPDLGVGAPGGDYARVFSGATLAPLWTGAYSSFELESYAPSWVERGMGAAIRGLGDQDGDGHDDVAVGYPGYSSVHVFSGADGAPLERITSAHQITNVSADVLGVHFGQALDTVADRNGDGRRELLVGAPFDFERESGGPGADYDVGGVAVVAVDSAPRWVHQVRSIGRAGDLDGDGHDDIAYGYIGELRVVSGRTGAILMTVPGVPIDAIRPAGDVDADGVDDLVLGNRGAASWTGEVVVLSGADGSILHTRTGDARGDRFGTSVAGVGDLDGDGFDDFAAGAPLSNNPSGIGGSCILGAGYVRVFSGHTGAQLLELVGEGLPGWNCDWGPWSEAFGFSLTGTGDWNLDGVPDIAVGAPGGGPGVGGEVRVFSGADGSLLFELAGTHGGELGVALDGGPHFDVDADGRVDLVIGEQVVAYSSPHQTVGWAHVVSSAGGRSLGTFSGTPPQQGYSNSVGPGYAVAALRDFDLDGHSDVVFGNPVAPGPLGPGVGEVRVYSGRTGKLLAQLDGNSSWDYLGYSVVAAGDVNGDGASDVLALALPSFLPNADSRAGLLKGHAPKPARVRWLPRPSR